MNKHKTHTKRIGETVQTDIDRPNNNPTLIEELKNYGNGQVIHDPTCPFCRGVGIISAPIKIDDTIKYKTQITC